MTRSRRAEVVPFAFAVVACATAGRTLAQCTNPWAPMPAAPQIVQRMVEWDPDGPGPAEPVVVLGGRFDSIGGVAANHVAVWDPATGAVSPLGTGLDGIVYSLAAGPGGELYAGGVFLAAGGAPVVGIASWDGANWQPLGSGIQPSSSSPTVYDIEVMPNGDVVVGGHFQQAGGVAAPWVARWDGATWSAMGSLGGICTSLLLRDDGELLASRLGGVWSWTGSAWTPFGTALGGTVRSLAAMPDGRVAVGAQQLWLGDENGFTQAAPPLGGALFVDSDLYTVSPLPNGDVVVGGVFVHAGGQTANNIACWRDGGWQTFGTGLNGAPTSTLFCRGGFVLVAGSFSTVDGVPQARLARLDTTCPATAVDLGGGCAGSGGGNQLEAVTLPWVESTLRTRGQGLPGLAIVAVDTGLTPIVPGFPLASVFAEALPGCDLRLVPIVEQLHITTTGALESALFLPDTPPLVGVTFLQQMVAVEIDPSLAIVEITVSNVLQLTAGRF